MLYLNKFYPILQIMKPFCEVVVATILPALRAALAKELAQTHGLSQPQIARKLGITQPAVSQYKRDLRGRTDILQSNRHVMVYVKKLAAKIASGHVSPWGIQESFCEICEGVRKDIICDLHKGMLPALAPCDFCFR
jgi:hypothetical protein